MWKWLLVGVWLLGLGLASSLGSAIAQTNADESALQVEQTVEPAQIVVRGTGTPDVATVTIALKSPLRGEGPPMDLMLVLDRSASVELERVKEIARTFIEHLSPQDRVGIVSFADVAQLELALTDDREKALETLDGLVAGDRTALGDGLLLALDEIKKSGRKDAFRLIVLPTDGVSNAGEDPRLQAERAGQENVPIYAIAISPAARRALLDELARMSHGVFYMRFSLDVLESVFAKAEREVVARQLLLTQLLPAGIVYAGALKNPPGVSPGHQLTRLEWHLSLFFEGQHWQTQYQISASREGSFNLNEYPLSVQYVGAQGQTVIVEVTTPVSVEARSGPGAPSPGPGGPGPGGPEGPQPPEEGQPNEPPTAQLDFSPQEPVMGEAVRFDASGSSDPDGKIVKYEWDWTNDGTFDLETQDPKAIHPYGRPGEFTVRLRVTDDKGATAEATVTVAVVQGLRPEATYIAEFKGEPTVPEWMSYYIDDGAVTDEEVRDANARFAADVFIPGTQYRLTSDDVQAIIQINQLAQLVAKYERPDAAEADGYAKVGDFIEQIGQLYVKAEFLKEPPRFDRPPVLLYSYDEQGKLKLAGVRFISLEKDAALFQITDWPQAPAQAYYEDGSTQKVDSLDKVKPENAKGSPLVFWHPPLYGLHVWVGVVNPNGLFAWKNPEVKQP